MNTNLLSIVKHITAQYGESILAEPARLKAYFSDLAKDEPKPLRIAFGRCVEAGAYNALKTAPNAAERIARKASLAQNLRNQHGVDIALSIEALDIVEAVIFGTASTARQSEPPVEKEKKRDIIPSVIAMGILGGYYGTKLKLGVAGIVLGCVVGGVSGAILSVFGDMCFNAFLGAAVGAKFGADIGANDITGIIVGIVAGGIGGAIWCVILRAIGKSKFVSIFKAILCGGFIGLVLFVSVFHVLSGTMGARVGAVIGFIIGAVIGIVVRPHFLQWLQKRGYPL